MENGLAVPGVVGTLEERAVYRLQKEIRGNALRLSKDKRFAHRLHHRSDHEIAAQLEGMRPPWLVGDDRHTAAGSLEQGTNSLHRRRGSANRHPHPAPPPARTPAE